MTSEKQAPETTPEQLYAARIAANDSDRQLLERHSLRLSIARLVVVVLTVGLLWLVLDGRLLAPAWLLVPGLIFVVLALQHRQVELRLERARRCLAWYRRGLARLDGSWVGKGRQGERFADAEHPCADDLDLLGHGSLFELLCTARTSLGERTLAGWLLTPATAPEIGRRQAAVAELRPDHVLRERLALLGERDRIVADTDGIERWLSGPTEPRATTRAQATAALLSLLVVVAVGGWLGQVWGMIPVAAAVLAHNGFTLHHRSWVRRVLAGLRWPARELSLLVQLLRTFAGQPFQSPLLVHLRGALRDDDGAGAELEINRLRSIVERVDWCSNMLFSPIAWLLLWHLHQACAGERWRRRCRPLVPAWFAAIGELEALVCLGGYAFEHPQDPFPEMTGPGSRLTATGLTHPLLPAATAVRNDLQLGGATAGAKAGHPRVLIVSGSNMSGKSTLLRSLGCNVVLAQMGAPVRAHAMSLPPLKLGASMCRRDSLLEGRSRFFAEIVRLKQILDLCQDRSLTVLFLLDEIFHGTNSHDRRRGAELYLERLLAVSAVGLVTTHDLALAELAETLAPEVGNVHLADQVRDGELHFDYRLRQGPVRHSNALALMRAIGLLEPPAAAPSVTEVARAGTDHPDGA